MEDSSNSFCPDRRSTLRALGGALFSLPLLPFGMSSLFPSFLDGGNSSAPSSNYPFFFDPPPENPKKLSGIPEKRITIYNVHTGEWIKRCVFWQEGKFVPDAIKRVDRLFRDHRTGQSRSIDPKLLHILYSVSKKLDTQRPIHLVSGYRCRETNEMLRRQDGGVAKKSQHVLGRAADIFIEGRPLRQIQRAAASMRAGGVGCYTSFVHIDTGTVRRWGIMA